MNRTATTMMKLVGTHATLATMTIYRDERTMEQSVRLMRECGYTVAIETGYTVAA